MFWIFYEIVFGYFLADVLTGTFHWFEDTYLDYCTTVLFLSSISRDNDLHHYYPRSMLTYSYLENIMFPTVSTSILVLIITQFTNNYRILLLTFGILSSTSNLIHRFSHMKRSENMKIVLFLQDIGIFCSVGHHKLHHTHFDRSYCVISEYSNYVLDKINYWRLLEYIIYKITGVIPLRKNYDIRNVNPLQEPTKKIVEESIEYLRKINNCTPEN